MLSSDQGKFLSIKNLDPDCKWFYRSYESDYPLRALIVPRVHNFIGGGEYPTSHIACTNTLR